MSHSKSFGRGRTKRSTSKYAKLRTVYPVMPLKDDELRAQEIVDQIKAKLVEEGEAAPELLVAKYFEFRLQKERLEDQLDNTQKNLTAIEQLLYDSHAEQHPIWGLYGGTEDMIKMPDGSSISVEIEPAAQVEDQEAFDAWCRENGYERSMHLPYGTMNSLAKARAEVGEPPLPGTAVYLRKKVKMRRG